jgi:hypothetical protein
VEGLLGLLLVVMSMNLWIKVKGHVDQWEMKTGEALW